MNRLAAANRTELSRADAKAAVLLTYAGAMLGAFITVTRITGDGTSQTPGPVTPMWWAAVATTILATSCFVSAIAPRHRTTRDAGHGGPVYFGDISSGVDDQTLLQRFEDLARTPEGALPTSLRRTSEIARAKYLWIDIGSALLLTSLPLLVAALHTT